MQPGMTTCNKGSHTRSQSSRPDSVFGAYRNPAPADPLKRVTATIVLQDFNLASTREGLLVGMYKCCFHASTASLTYATLLNLPMPIFSLKNPKPAWKKR
jgi:hypothetical protein